MTYANAVLPHALFVAARRWPEDSFLAVAEASFAFLDQQTTMENVFWPIGNSDWYPHGEEKSLYDQQPVEAATMAEAALAGFRLLGDEKYLATFRRAYDWFQGRNSLGQQLADVRCGACCDGLQASGVNRNQGAESTLAYLWAELRNFDVRDSVGDIRKAAGCHRVTAAKLRKTLPRKEIGSQDRCVMSRSTNRKGGQNSLSVRRLPVTFAHDFHRVITRFFDPGGEARSAPSSSESAASAVGRSTACWTKYSRSFAPATATLPQRSRRITTRQRR